jgi:hypothetical protein
VVLFHVLSIQKNLSGNDKAFFVKAQLAAVNTTWINALGIQTIHQTTRYEYARDDIVQGIVAQRIKSASSCLHMYKWH